MPMEVGCGELSQEHAKNWSKTINSEVLSTFFHICLSYFLVSSHGIEWFFYVFDALDSGLKCFFKLKGISVFGMVTSLLGLH